MGVFVCVCGGRGNKITMQKLSGIKLKPHESLEDLVFKASKKAGFKRSEVKYFKLIKKSLDARDKSDVFFNCSVEISNKEYKPIEKVYNKVEKQAHVLVVGAGPAGLFCALDLLRYGLSVTLIERGKSVDEREKSVSNFINNKILDIDSNVQFGEGGAGTFSDGKLNTGVNGELVKEVINDFLRFGLFIILPLSLGKHRFQRVPAPSFL